MNKKPVISLVIPIYGVEKYIGKFAESVLGQSYPDIQFVFVNDGTKDSSIGILTTLIEEKFSHLKEQIIIINKQNEGLPAARRTGMEHVTGDYVWHIDSDDWISEEAVAKIAEEIIRTDADIVYFDFAKEYADRTAIKREREYSGETKSRYIKNIFSHKSYGCTWNKCFRVALFRNNVIYTPRYAYGEDPYLTLQLISFAKSISHVPEVLYHYRKDNPHAITKTSKRSQHKAFVLNFLDLYEKIRCCSVNDNPLAVLCRPILRRARWYNFIHHLGLTIRK